MCALCGLIGDFESDHLNRLPTPDALRELGGVLEARVEVRGVCARCGDGAENVTELKPNQPGRSES